MKESKESPRSTEFKRAALLEGNRAGKLPKRVGKWYWPLGLLGLTLGTVWGVRHIEPQVEHAAPQIIRSAGIDPTGLAFDANYRNLDVTGTLPENTSTGHLKMILAKFTGQNGESIRRTNIDTVSPVIAEVEEPVVPAVVEQPLVTPQPEIVERADVRISAITDGEQLTLTGMVPSRKDVDLLTEAARQSFSTDNIVNTVGISDAPATKENADQHINEFATILSNLDDSIVDAQLDLDNDLMTGNITTASLEAGNKAKALIAGTLVGVTTNTQIDPVIPVVTDPVLPAASEVHADTGILRLQDEISRLSDDIREQVVFAPASDVLQPSATGILDAIVAALQTHTDTSIEISGHTDSHSSATYNQELSQRRAQAVADYIASRGIDTMRLRAVGYGETQPVASNETSAGRARNRRVEFWAY